MTIEQRSRRLLALKSTFQVALLSVLEKNRDRALARYEQEPNGPEARNAYERADARFDKLLAEAESTLERLEALA